VGAAEVIVDASALVAILHGEPGAGEFKSLVAGSVTYVSAATALEAAIVVTPGRHHELDQLLVDGDITVVPFDHAQAKVAREAYARFGRRSGSKAQLNFGDSITYALAKVTGEPLLFKGDDFTHTDITPAR
jgi:ribonuclease VapC